MPRLEIVRGDIIAETTDAIVNAANSSLLGGGGVDGAIHQAVGKALRPNEPAGIEQGRPGGLPTGQAVATPGFALAARWVIHTVGPVYGVSPTPERDLARCHVASLAVADELGARSVAFPAISAGAYGYPIAEAARVALSAVRSAETHVEFVRFVLFNAEAYEAFVGAS